MDVNSTLCRGGARWSSSLCIFKHFVHILTSVPFKLYINGQTCSTNVLFAGNSCNVIALTHPELSRNKAEGDIIHKKYMHNTLIHRKTSSLPFPGATLITLLGDNAERQGRR